MHFSLFQNHLDLAHFYWARLLQIGDAVIDATCGNGKDSLVLAKLILNEDMGRLVCIDIQENAIINTQNLLKATLLPKQFSRISFSCQSHEILPDECVKLIVYNLGYLPGGNKTVTTQAESTLSSLKKALNCLQPGGVICVSCYPGHPEGLLEENRIFCFISELNPYLYNVCVHKWVNKTNAPSLIIIQNKITN